MSPRQESTMRRFFATDRVLADDVRRFMRDECGATAIEYALIAAGVSVAIVTAVTGLGSQIQSTFYDKLTNMF
jgi:pilus assembly protein Flp/PilA